MLTSVIRPFTLFVIISCSIFAARSKNLKKTIIYSAAAQTGYIAFLITIKETLGLVFNLLIFDGLNKIAMFTITTILSDNDFNFDFKKIKLIEQSYLTKILIVLALIYSSGFPLTSLFIVKIEIYKIIVEEILWIEFVTIILSSALSIFYHLKICLSFFFISNINGTIKINKINYGLISIIVLQIVSLIFINSLFTISNQLN